MASLTACWVASLSEEVPGKLEICPYIGTIIQSEQGKFDLGMARISMELSCIGAEEFTKQVRIFLHGSEQLVVFEQRIVCESGLDQMTTIVPGWSAVSDEIEPQAYSQLVHISQIGETPSRLYHGVMNIEVAIRLLCRCYHIDELVDSALHFR